MIYKWFKKAEVGNPAVGEKEERVARVGTTQRDTDMLYTTQHPALNDT